MKWFGEPWPSAEKPAGVCEDRSQQVQTPVGVPCGSCEKEIQDGDRGVVIPQVSEHLHAFTKPWHIECLLENVLGPEWRRVVEPW